MENNEIRSYFERWKRRKSHKFKKAVQAAAEEKAVEMFIDLVKELDRAKSRLALHPVTK